MKVLIISDKGFESGGVSTYIKSLSSELEHRKHIIKILTSNIYLEGARFSHYDFKGIKDTNTFIWYINRLFNFNSYIKTNQILKQFKPDIVHINYIDLQASPSIIFPLKKTPTIMTLHDYSIICSPNKMIHSLGSNHKNSIKGILFEKVKKVVYRIALNNIDLLISPSKSVESHFINNNISNIKTVYNGIKLFKFSNISNFSKLLYIGRLSEEKGIKYLIKAMPFIVDKIPKIHLDIIGIGPEKSNLMKMIKFYNIEKNISFIGQLPNNKIEKYYKNASIIVIPSICQETFSLVGIEAMSVGRPVIASRIGGIPEWLDDGSVGYLVEPGNYFEIAEKVILLLKDRKLMNIMSKNARNKALLFDIQTHINKIEKIYKEIIHKYQK